MGARRHFAGQVNLFRRQSLKLFGTGTNDGAENKNKTVNLPILIDVNTVQFILALLIIRDAAIQGGLLVKTLK